MSIKLKALGLGLITAMAMGAFAAVNASAIVSGHFALEEQLTVIRGSENESNHRIRFSRHNSTKEHLVYRSSATKPLTWAQRTPRQ